MTYFNCDYHEGAHPRLLQALTQSNLEQTVGYGEDPYCQKAAEAIKALCKGEVDVHFLVGGTQTNLTVISGALRPHQSVLCAVQGHIQVHETGAIEAGGHKIEPLDSADGKISARQVEAAVTQHYENGAFEHTTQPKLVYLSHPTELGTLYSREELTALHAVCQKHALLLYLDGARLGYGLAARQNDLDLETITALCDAFYIGGTKVGALFGEALVIKHPLLRQDFRYLMKQKGGLLAKGRLLGLQFYELFRDGLYFEIAAHGIRMAEKLRQAFLDCGHKLVVDGGTNQLFVQLPDGMLKELGKQVTFEEHSRVDAANRVVRFCTSWATQEAQVDALIGQIRRLS